MGITGQQTEYHLNERLRFLIISKPLDILLYDGDTILHRVAVAIGFIIPYGDTLVSSGIGKGVCALAVLFQFQDFRLHVDHAAEVIQYAVFHGLDAVAYRLQVRDRLLDRFVHQFLVGLAVTFGLFLGSLGGLFCLERLELFQFFVRHFNGFSFFCHSFN